MDPLQTNVNDAELLQGNKPIQDEMHQLQRVTATLTLSIFEDRNELEALAFPTLYPDGSNGFGTVRDTKVPQLEYF